MTWNGIIMPMDAQARREAEVAEEAKEVLGAAQQANYFRVSSDAQDLGFALRDVIWPNVKHYGFDHAKATAELCVHMGQGVGLPVEDLLVLRTVAWLHDLGREVGEGQLDPQHAERGAERAERLLKAGPWWSKPERVDAVCRRIAAHSLYTTPSDDPLLRILDDAECLEGFRFPSSQRVDAEVLRRLGRIRSDWARHPEHQRRWRDKYR